MTETLTDNIFLNQMLKNYHETASGAAGNAQFAFDFAPFSTNKLWLPTVNHTTGHSRLYLNPLAGNFKEEIYRSIQAQKRRDSSRAYGWEKLNKTYSFWVLLRKGHEKCESMDASNAIKALEDAFVTAGVIPNDKHSIDPRAMYADFSKHEKISPKTVFMVLIRWIDDIDPPNLFTPR